MASAHWEAAATMLGATEPAPLVYDFAGFPRRFYDVTYPALGAPGLADQVAALLPDNEHVVRTNRGLDHGAYIPPTVMYPDADVPVLQMPLPTLEPDRLLALGARLRPLRDQGVLIIGSGVHHPRASVPDPRALAIPRGPRRLAGRSGSTTGPERHWPPATSTPWPRSGTARRACRMRIRPASTSHRCS